MTTISAYFIRGWECRPNLHCIRLAVMHVVEWWSVREPKERLGTLRAKEATAARKSPYFLKCRWTLLKLNPKGPYLSLEKKIKFCRCLFTLSLKHEIRHFDVSVVQRRQRNVQKKCAARSILLFCSLNLLLLLFVCLFFFWRSRCHLYRWILSWTDS